MHYLNIDVYYPQLVIILAEKKKKIMYTGRITVKDMTGENLKGFFEKFKKGELDTLGMTEYVGQDYYL